MKLIIIIIAVLIFGYVVWGIGTALLQAYLEHNKKPKEEMFWCNICSPKYGPFRKKHCLPLFPELQGKPLNSFVCPMCYKKVVFDDPNRKLYG
jgi:hypothetical protein